MANFFGFEIKRAAPRVAIAGTAFETRALQAAVASSRVPDLQASARHLQLPPIHASEFPAQPPIRRDQSGLTNRNIQSDPLGDWYLNLPDKVPPKQISSILRMALAGNLWQQTQLSRLMSDSWPVFAKCQFELRSAIASAKYVVHPYKVKGKEPSPSAEDKADLVRKALEETFEPDRFADEDGCHGMIFDLTDAIINGVSIAELIWNDEETAVRASAWVHPRNLGFTPDGRIGVANSAESGGLSFSNQIRNELQDDPHKFVVAKFKSKSGSALGAGWMRKLAWYWVMVVYGRDFAMNFMQKYGNPFFDVAYTSGITDQNEIDKFERLAALAANQGYIVHPDSSKITIGAGQAMAGDNAHLAMMRLADEQCQQLMLGQTLTSDAPKNGGTRAQGEVHAEVKSDRLEEHCKWMARILTEQFAESILAVNYGRSYAANKERPTIMPDLNRAMSAAEQAEYFSKVGQSRVPVLAEEVYERTGLTQPEPGDTVLIAGDLVVMEDVMTMTEKGQKDFDTQLEQQATIHEVFGEPETTPEDVTAALAAAAPGELAELEQLVTAAERAPHRNGEATMVKQFVQRLAKKRR